MTRQIQLRRGSAAENDAFTGAVGEITMDTTNNTLRVHDGTTAGGIKLAKQNEIPEIPNIPTNEQMAHAAMPSGRHIEITPGPSGSSYTAPADGYYTARFQATTASQELFLCILNNGVELIGQRIFSASSGNFLMASIPVSKGDEIKFYYSNNDYMEFRFVYANGTD